jgi:hypothetical protein
MKRLSTLADGVLYASILKRPSTFQITKKGGR